MPAKKEKEISRISFILEGEMPSKKNSWKRGQHGNTYIPEEIKDWLEIFYFEIISKKNKAGLVSPIKGPVRVVATFYLPKVRFDTDNQYTTLQDLLQKAGVIENDRRVAKFEVDRVIGAPRPLVALTVEKTVEKVWMDASDTVDKK